MIKFIVGLDFLRNKIELVEYDEEGESDSVFFDTTPLDEGTLYAVNKENKVMSPIKRIILEDGTVIECGIK